MVPAAQEESGFQGAVLFMFRSHVYDDLVVPGAQEESVLQGTVLFSSRSQLYAMYMMVHHPGFYKRTSWLLEHRKSLAS